MYDDNTVMVDERLQTADSPDYMAGLGHWSPLVAGRIAEEEGLTLTEAHWEVIFCLREWFREYGPDWTARQITHQMEADYADVGGLRHLYELFPHGPLAQGCRVAGLPLPRGTISTSFGSVH